MGPTQYWNITGHANPTKLKVVGWFCRLLWNPAALAVLHGRVIELLL
jgi:hypothetical protein